MNKFSDPCYSSSVNPLQDLAFTPDGDRVTASLHGEDIGSYQYDSQLGQWCAVYTSPSLDENSTATNLEVEAQAFLYKKAIAQQAIVVYYLQSS